MDRRSEVWRCGARAAAAFVGAVALAVGAGLGPCPCAAGAAGPAAKLPKMQTPYYWLYAKLEKPLLQETSARLTAVAREYHRRTKGFKGAVTERMPVYIFTSKPDYVAAGGPESSEGIYADGPILAYWDQSTTKRLWEILQHECFHQFVWQVIRGHWPAWLNEGMATYFEEGLWTGDGFVTGIIPENRLRHVKRMINEKKVKPFQDFMAMDNKTWSDTRGGEESWLDYCQAWSMVHFMLHGGDAKNRELLDKYMKWAAELPDTDWRRRQGDLPRRVFGSGLAKLQESWEKWWLAATEELCADLRAEAAVSALTCFLARAHLAGMRFASAEEFLQAAREEKLPSAPKDREDLWLPPALLKDHLAAAGKLRDWRLGKAGKLPALRATFGDDLYLIGSFELKGAKTLDVTVERQKASAAPPAKEKAK